MIRRYALAVVGAAGVTFGLLYGMSGITALFLDRDPTRYFQITDVIVNPRGGRPPPIPASREAPERPRVEYAPGDGPSIDVERPSVDGSDSLDRIRIRPRLEEAPVSD